LGLALTRRLVEAQGGSVGVESTLETGSVFFAVLPCVTTAPEALTQKQNAQSPKRMPGVPTMLIIDDDANDQERLIHAGDAEYSYYCFDCLRNGRGRTEGT
jgi:hypothetical protein